MLKKLTIKLLKHYRSYNNNCTCKKLGLTKINKVIKLVCELYKRLLAILLDRSINVKYYSRFRFFITFFLQEQSHEIFDLNFFAQNTTMFLKFKINYVNIHFTKNYFYFKKQKNWAKLKFKKIYQNFQLRVEEAGGELR